MRDASYTHPKDCKWQMEGYQGYQGYQGYHGGYHDYQDYQGYYYYIYMYVHVCTLVSKARVISMARVGEE